jgi:glyoxylase-like metal-dependent hydrolase (beta-lactamase superfamily II)/8-oxo-dGTP pyrophosphatase MutT (NUDIX family)
MLPPKPAATLVLARDSSHGLQVLMLRRSLRADFIAGVFVFPGGGVDDADSSAEAQALCGEGRDDPQWVEKFCAIRECFEEAGLLLAGDETGGLPEPAALAEWRRRLNAGEATLAQLCREGRLNPAIHELAYFSHWITPLGVPRRFDTRYFVARAPEGQIPSHDAAETTEHVWTTPAEALARHARREIELVLPTVKTLEALDCFDTVEALLSQASLPRPIVPIQPRLGTGRAGIRPVGPDEPSYAEIGRLDPLGQARAAYEILPGVAVALAPSLRRLTANNANFMTGPGTNSYLLDTGDGIAVIDPGPDDPAHVDALVEDAGGPIRWILATHTHPDHSPAAARLAARTGAQVWGLPAPAGRSQDESFRPQRLLRDGEVLFAGASRLRVLHTPGHASNHLCYLLEGERLLLAGDHIMQGSTVVIDPPDGDMAAYLASLRRLLAEDTVWIAPAHGFLMDRPRARIEWILHHRLERENKVCNALAVLGPSDPDALLPLAYDDVPARIHRLARRSLLAHLEKLRLEGRAVEDAGRWITL